MGALCLMAASVSAVFALGFSLSRRPGPLTRTMAGILACAAIDFSIDARYYGAGFPGVEPKPWLSLMAVYGILVARLYRLLGDVEERRGAPHFLPFSVLLPAAASDIIVHGLSLYPATDGSLLSFVVPGLHAATGLGVLACCLLPAIMVFRFHSPKRMDASSCAVFGLSVAGALALAAGLAGLVSRKAFFFAAMDCLKACTVFAGAILSFRWPDALGDFRKRTAKGRYRVSTLDGLDVEGLLRGMEERIRKTEWFLDPECSLEGLALLMGMTRNQVSELLNARLGLSFSAYVSGFRIQRARELLGSKPELTILAVAGASGFGNKTSFNETFLRETGMTPREYRKRGMKRVER